MLARVPEQLRERARAGRGGPLDRRSDAPAPGCATQRCAGWSPCRRRTPSLRLLADQTAEVLAGIAHALNGLALLVADPARPAARSRGSRRLRIPDWLPPLVNGGRAFVVIGAAELFWIVTAWPDGAKAITFAAIIVDPVRAARRPSLRDRDRLHDRQSS